MNTGPRMSPLRDPGRDVGRCVEVDPDLPHVKGEVEEHKGVVGDVREV